MAQLNLNRTEIKMLKEVSLILKKYNKDKKFGIQLLHSHFNIDADEILHETNNKVKRQLLTKAIKKNKLPKGSYATSWSLDVKGMPCPLLFCCDGTDNGTGKPLYADKFLTH